MTLNNKYIIAGEEFKSDAVTDDELAEEIFETLKQTMACHVIIKVDPNSDGIMNYDLVVASLVSYIDEDQDFFLGVLVDSASQGFINSLKKASCGEYEIIFDNAIIKVENFDGGKVELDLDGLDSLL